MSVASFISVVEPMALVWISVIVTIVLFLALWTNDLAWPSNSFPDTTWDPTPATVILNPLTLTLIF